VRASGLGLASIVFVLAAASQALASGASFVRDIDPGPDSGLPRSFPGSFADVGGIALFPADDGTHGIELWRSDGSADGTKLVRDIYPGISSSDPQHLASVGGTLFFAADDGNQGLELWRSDGTASGTKLVRDI
jgi:ELWxxDGT repeat protein